MVKIIRIVSKRNASAFLHVVYLTELITIISNVTARPSHTDKDPIVFTDLSEPNLFYPTVTSTTEEALKNIEVNINVTAVPPEHISESKTSRRRAQEGSQKLFEPFIVKPLKNMTTNKDKDVLGRSVSTNAPYNGSDLILFPESEEHLGQLYPTKHTTKVSCNKTTMHDSSLPSRIKDYSTTEPNDLINHCQPSNESTSEKFDIDTKFLMDIADQDCPQGECRVYEECRWCE